MTDTLTRALQALPEPATAHDHPEPQTHVWTETELRWIARRDEQWRAALAAASAPGVPDAELRHALADMLAGWRYIRQAHGDLYGVGWDRAQSKAEKALGLEPNEPLRDGMFPPPTEQPEQARQPLTDEQLSPTAGMTIEQRILHVGGRNNAAGYVEFGSTQAVRALVLQVLRDQPKRNRTPIPDNELVTMYEEAPTSDAEMIEFARAIESAHGILPATEQKQPLTDGWPIRPEQLDDDPWAGDDMMGASG